VDGAVVERPGDDGDGERRVARVDVRAYRREVGKRRGLEVEGEDRPHGRSILGVHAGKRLDCPVDRRLDRPERNERPVRGTARRVWPDGRQLVGRRRLDIREFGSGVDLRDTARVDLAPEPCRNPLLFVAAFQHPFDDCGFVVGDPQNGLSSLSMDGGVSLPHASHPGRAGPRRNISSLDTIGK